MRPRKREHDAVRWGLVNDDGSRNDGLTAREVIDSNPEPWKHLAAV
jgi:hypothetical protein